MTKKMVAAYGISVALLLVSIWCGISIGSVSVPISTLWDAESNPTAYSILWNIRMPRVILAALVGAALAIAAIVLLPIFAHKDALTITSVTIYASTLFVLYII